MCEKHFTRYQRKGWEHQETNRQIDIGYDACRVFTPVNEVPDGKAGDQTCGKAYDESRLGKVEPLVAMYPSSSQSRLFMDVRCSHSVFAVVG